MSNFEDQNIYIYIHTHTHIYIYGRVNICRTAFTVLNSKVERSTVDVKQINSRFDWHFITI